MYAGPMGWLGGDGCEFAVAIRSALTHAADENGLQAEGSQPEAQSGATDASLSGHETGSSAGGVNGAETWEERTSGEANGRQGGESTSGRTDESDVRSLRSGGRAKAQKWAAKLKPSDPQLDAFDGKIEKEGNGTAGSERISQERSLGSSSEMPTAESNGSGKPSQAGSLKKTPETKFRPGRKISLFAGVGIVKGADPLAEWRELNLKTSQVSILQTTD